MSFVVYPAIDVRDGRVVRLAQGDYARETRYGDDPEALALRYLGDGARWLHLVDLDAARAGGYTQTPLLRRLAHAGLSVQTGGGVRSESDVVALLEAGAARVVIGSLAVTRPDTVCRWISRHGPERFTLAFDTRRGADGRWELPVHGWTAASGRHLDELLACYRDSGLRHGLCTDIGRDGMLSGPNFHLYRELRTAAPWLQLQASGGARQVEDVVEARVAGCAGIVLGRALLEARIDLRAALEAA